MSAFVIALASTMFVYGTIQIKQWQITKETVADTNFVALCIHICIYVIR